MFRNLDEDREEEPTEGQLGSRTAAGRVAPNRAEGSRSSKGRLFAKKVDPTLIVVGMALIARVLLVLRASLSLVLLNTASLLVIAPGVMLLPERSAPP